MKVSEDLTITGMHLNGYKLSVPKGLSELMNRTGGWKYTRQDNSSDVDIPLEDYERKVVMEDGNLRTYLTYKEPSLTVRQNKKIS